MRRLDSFLPPHFGHDCHFEEWYILKLLIFILEQVLRNLPALGYNHNANNRLNT
jgi:hypothetical protein